MSGKQEATRLRLDVAVDRQRQVVSLNFTPVASGDSTGVGFATVSPTVTAAKLVAAEPNIVIKLNDEGRLLGIDIFDAAGTLGLDDLEDIALTLRTGG